MLTVGKRRGEGLKAPPRTGIRLRDLQFLKLLGKA